MVSQPNEKDIEYVDNLLRRYYQIPADSRSEYFLHSFATALERSISARVAFELINRRDNKENISKKYELGRYFMVTGGLYYSPEKIANDVWIPQKYLADTLAEEAKGNITSRILAPDEMNVFNTEKTFGLLDDAKKIEIREILSPKGTHNHPSWGKQRQLLLDNREWRAKARDYTIFMLETIRSENEYFPSSKMSIPEKMSCRGIDIITGFYLSEMKQK